MKRRVIILVAGLAVFAAILAAAASLTVNSDTLGAGGDTVESCDTDGVFVSGYNSNPNFIDGQPKVGSVDVKDIAVPACLGKTVQVFLSDANDLELGSGEKTVGSANESVLLSPNPPASDIANVDVVITG